MIRFNQYLLFRRVRDSLFVLEVRLDSGCFLLHFHKDFLRAANCNCTIGDGLLRKMCI